LTLNINISITGSTLAVFERHILIYSSFGKTTFFMSTPHVTSRVLQGNRIACDRCRGQKLRCVYIDESRDSCQRCQRARVQCIHSPSKRMSRQPTHERRISIVLMPRLLYYTRRLYLTMQSEKIGLEGKRQWKPPSMDKMTYLRYLIPHL